MKQEQNKNILAKMHAIMSEVNFIQKDKTNDFHGYNYASEKAIKERLHDLLVKHKVVLSFEVCEATTTVVPGPKGNDVITMIKTIYTFWDIESGESFGGVFHGSGADKGDKGLYKAITGSIKYILTSAFLIPTGDDPENEKRPKATNKKMNTDVDPFDKVNED